MESDDHTIEQWMQAVRAADQGEPVRALAISDQLASAGCKSVGLHALRAGCLLDLRQYDEALLETQQIVSSEPDDWRYQLLHAKACWGCRRLTWAQQALERARQLSRYAPEVELAYAQFMTAERGPKLALEAAERAVRLNPEEADAWVCLAQAQDRMHQRAAARASAERALQLSPNNTAAQLLMAAILEREGEIDQAMALADLLEDAEDAKPAAEEIRHRAKMKKVSRMLVERGATFPEHDPSAYRSRRTLLYVLAIATIWAVAVVALGFVDYRFAALAAIPLAVLLWRFVIYPR